MSKTTRVKRPTQRNRRIQGDRGWLMVAAAAALLFSSTPSLAGPPGKSSSANAPNVPGYSKIQINPKFRGAVTSNPFLMDGMWDTIEVEGKRYLVSVGTSPANPARASDPRTRMSWMKVAQSNAKKNVMNYLSGRVDTETYIDKKTETKTVKSGKNVERTKRVDKVMRSWTSESARGALMGAIPIGTWYTADGTMLYSGIAIPLD